MRFSAFRHSLSWRRYQFAYVLMAAAWALLFAAISFYWAAGGTFGLSTISPTITSQLSSPAFIAVIWATGIAKVAAAAVVLALLLPLPALASIWITRANVIIGIGCLAYGGLNMLVQVVATAGLLPISFDVTSPVALWYLFFWNPFWMLGGALFLLAGRAMVSGKSHA